MIKVSLYVDDRCQNCPEFKEHVVVDRHYADNSVINTDVRVLCEHTHVCRHIEKYLKGGD